MRIKVTGLCPVLRPSSVSAAIRVPVVTASAGRMQMVNTTLVTPTITRESLNLRTFDDMKVDDNTIFGMLKAGTIWTIGCFILALSNITDLKLITITVSQSA